MDKKSSHWVTIPEDTVHTPVSKSKKGKQSPVQNKMLWGAGFVMLIIFTVALLAPRQFASLLRGSLFETEGGIVQIVPEEAAGTEFVTDEEAPEDTEAETGSEPTEQLSDDTVVEAQTEAVTIKVEPVETDAEPAETDTEIIPETTEETEEQPSDLEQELDTNRQLLEELSKQVEEFKQKTEEKDAVIEELAGMLQEEVAKEEVRPSAPTGVTTTTTIGTSSAYRVNTHVVTITPQEVLRQNTAQIQLGAQTAQQPAVQGYYAGQLASDGTPETGPKEAMLLALILSFIALIGWRLFRFARV